MTDLVYCASERAIVAAAFEYHEESGEFADANGLAAALVAAHKPELGLDRSVCLRDVIDALRGPEGQGYFAGAREVAEFLEREFGSGS